MMKLRFLLPVLAVACASTERPACSPNTLAALEARYIAEAAAACAGHTYDDCPALPEIRAKYKTEREEWVQCR
jgi:hypothetical protein